jgi:hypothetical protein
MILLATAGAAGAGSPPTQPFKAMDWAATSARPVAGVMLGHVQVQLEQTTLPQVLGVAATGRIAHGGDAGERSSWLCYTVPGQHPGRLWLISGAEMGGPAQPVTAITLESVAHEAAAADCPVLPPALRPVLMDPRVGLRMTDAQVEQVLGVPSHREGPWRSFNFQAKVAGKCAGGYDRMNWLVTGSQDGKVTSLYAGQVTSC